MSDIERERAEEIMAKTLNEQRELEQSIVGQHITRSWLEKKEDRSFADGSSVRRFVLINIEKKRFMWNEEDFLVPDYESIAEIFKLSPEVLEDLRIRSLATGEMPDVILPKIVSEGLRFINKVS